MSGKKWLFMLFSAVLAVLVCWGLWNVITDPFGVFGTPALPWDSYSQTLDPRNGKGVYISRRFDEFDSYIVGSSSAASYLPETLEKYTGGRFYNMFHYGADIEYDERLVTYLLENDDVKNIVLVVGLNEGRKAASDEKTLTKKSYFRISGEPALSYYSSFLFADPSYGFEKLQSFAKDTELPQTFDCFIPESGCYDKRVRDAEPISSAEEYMSLHGDDYRFDPAGVFTMENADPCIEAIARIKEKCSAAGTELLVICTPVYQSQLDTVSAESLDAFYRKLAQRVGFWNFAVSPVSYDPRYFYDVTHTRNGTADMVLARIFGDDDVYRPEGFGYFCSGGCELSVEEMKRRRFENNSVTLPVLMYHHLSDAEEGSATVISTESFRRQMELIRENGFAPVSVAEAEAFVYRGAPLPENPVMITFDDGYYSNYSLAYPILKEYGYPFTVFAVGSSFGRDRYKDTEHEITPHFGGSEAREMTESGLCSVQSHTFDMHAYMPFEDGSAARESILPLEGESERDHIEALRRDTDRMAELFRNNGLPEPAALSFPKGKQDAVADAVLKQAGCRATFTSDGARRNVITRGVAQSLIDVGRLAVTGNMSDEAILSYLSAK